VTVAAKSLKVDLGALVTSLDPTGNGTQDDGEYLVVDTRRLPAATSTATVRIVVTA
jgi:hypothetical protein